MPWTTKDVSGFTKAAKTAKQKRQWVAVANGALKRCLADGGSQEDCEASAIRQGNAVVKEDDMGEVTVTVAVPTVAENARISRVPDLPAGTLIPDVTAETLTSDTSSALVKEAAMKTVDGKKYPSGDFLVVEDSEKVDTWHLQVKRNGTPDHGLMGGAKAALTKTHRGNPYKGPDKAKALTKLKALYKAEDMEWKEMKEIELAEVGRRLNKTQLKQLKAAQETIATILSWADYADVVEEPEEEVVEEFAESSSGRVIGLAEATPVLPDSVVPLHLDAILIEPGWGNERDGHYYPREVLERDAGVFADVKMYESDHRQGEKSTRTWVSTVTGIKGFTDDGAPIGTISVHDRNFAERLLALNADELLEKMECSILAGGTAKKGKVGDKKAKIVESITEADSVDWVTRAGAGGRALALAETEEGSMDENETEVVEEEIEEVQISEDEEPETPAPEPVSDERVTERLGETNLPKASTARLSEAEYADEDALEEAVKAEIDYVKAITGSGEPFGMDGGPQEHKPLTEEEKDARYKKRLAEVDGGSV